LKLPVERFYCRLLAKSGYDVGRFDPVPKGFLPVARFKLDQSQEALINLLEAKEIIKEPGPVR
jgi:hypothetical protein